jgi:phosphoribosylaminoimidazolecarboxamide formyltransferase / IMP cyclohydrolase
MKKISSALISVYHKDNLAPIVELLNQNGCVIYSTGGTQDFIENLGIKVASVESLTGYPSILDGRVKTLHPKIFGGILAKRESDHLSQLEKYQIPEIDLVIVDLYPFEETVANTTDESTIIEKIDIGGISLIRAAAKNFNDVAIVPSMKDYGFVFEKLNSQQGALSLEDRKYLATQAFGVSSAYDTAIGRWFAGSRQLRYGENPHQKATFHGDLSMIFDIHEGKELSYNNLVDVDAAMRLIAEFKADLPTFAILKHTNACGIATRNTVLDAWKTALSCDPVSAFGGVFITNSAIDIETAREINQIFYEVVIAPAFSEEAFTLLSSKKGRIILTLKSYPNSTKQSKTILNGILEQDINHFSEEIEDLKPCTEKLPTPQECEDLLFALRCVKHLKSNSIALVKNKQLLGMGCGQTSRVDALRQAIHKSGAFGFDIKGAVMASEAFFPFPDCVQIAAEVGIVAISQPGGSIKDQDSIQECNRLGLAMLVTGIRHFLH